MAVCTFSTVCPATNEPYTYPTSTNYAYLRECYHEYLSACAAYLSRPLSAEKHWDILNTDAGSECVCSMEGPTVEVTRLLLFLHRFHTSRKFTYREFFYALVRHLGGVLSDAVESKNFGAFPAMRGLRKHAKNHTGNPLWPTDTDQLLPRGLSNSAQGYADTISLCIRDSVSESYVLPQQDPLLLFGKLIAICGRPVVPYFLNYRGDCSCAMLSLARQIWEEVAAAEGTVVDRSTELSWFFTIGVLAQFCIYTTSIDLRDPIGLFMLIRQRYPEEDEAESSESTSQEAAEAPWVFSHALVTCSVILHALPLLPKITKTLLENVVDAMTHIFSSAGAVFYAYRHPKDNNVYHREIVLKHMTSVVLATDPTKAAFDCIHWVLRARHCCAPECQETFGAAKRQFAQCSGCGLLRYCSRECQRTAWKYESLPHKDVCTKLRVLRERTGLPKDRDRWEPSRYREHFLNVCKADESLTALAEDCSAYIHGLKALRQVNNLDSATSTLWDIPGELSRELAPVLGIEYCPVPVTVDPSILCYMSQG